MKCPYCNEEMEKGVIVGERFSLSFISDISNKKGFLLPKRIKLKHFLDDELIAYHCSKCYKIIVDIDH